MNTFLVGFLTAAAIFLTGRIVWWLSPGRTRRIVVVGYGPGKRRD